MVEHQSSRLFTILALTTSLLTIGLIIFGAVVRITDSGLGCGNEWPLCDGRIIPPLDNLTAWIEWLHRLFAALIGLFGLAMLFVAIRVYRKQQNRSVLWVTVLAAVLFFIQSMLGAFVVIFDLPPTTVTLHLGMAMILLGTLLIATLGSWYRPTVHYMRDHVTTLAYITTGLTLIIILTGALVRGSGATLACLDWPLCNGAIFPSDQGQLQVVHMTHRLAVAALGICLFLLVWYVWRSRDHQFTRLLALTALGAYLAQAAVGAFFVLTVAQPLWGVAHVGLAAILWASLVVLSVVDTTNSRDLQLTEQDTNQKWKLQSEHSSS